MQSLLNFIKKYKFVKFALCELNFHNHLSNFISLLRKSSSDHIQRIRMYDNKTTTRTVDSNIAILQN